MVHGDNLIYARIDWENYPSDKTPVNESNLNKMDLMLYMTDERVKWLNDNKFDKSDSFKLVKNLELDEDTGVFTVTFYDNTTKKIDTLLEKIAINWDYDPVTQKIVLVLDDGERKYIDLSALITQYEFLDSDTVHFSVGSDGKISAIVREGSIEEKHLRPDYLSDIRVESERAESSADSAAQKAMESADGALLSKSYNSGNTGLREGEDTDNAKYYSEQARQALESLEQAGAVTGVKGSAEAAYRTGNVEIAPEDIGAPYASYINAHFVPDYVKTTTAIFSEKGWYRIAGAFTKYNTSCIITLKRFYNHGAPEYQKVQLIAGYAKSKLVPIAAFTESPGAKYFTKMRLARDAAANNDYLEIYYNHDLGNSIRATIDDAIGVIERDNWEMVEPIIVPETQSGVTVVASIDLPDNLDAYSFLQSGGQIPVAGKTGYIAYPSDAYYQANKSNVSGYIKITLPVSWTNTFVRFTVSIFTMGENESCDYHISGYNYAATPNWNHCAAVCVGKAGSAHSNLNVRFGHNGTKCVIGIGEIGTRWDYPVVQVHDVMLGYYKNDYETWQSGWNVSIGATSIATVSTTISNTHVAYGGVAGSCTEEWTRRGIATMRGGEFSYESDYENEILLVGVASSGTETKTSHIYKDVLIDSVVPPDGIYEYKIYYDSSDYISVKFNRGAFTFTNSTYMHDVYIYSR